MTAEQKHWPDAEQEIADVGYVAGYFRCEMPPTVAEQKALMAWAKHLRQVANQLSKMARS